LQGKQDVHYVFVAQYEIDFQADQLRAPGGIDAEGVEQGLKAVPGMMEMRNGFVQARTGQVRQETLEFAEGKGGFMGLMGRANEVVGGGALNEDVRSPARIGAIAVIGIAAMGGDEREDPLRWVHFAAVPQMGGEVRGDPGNVLHQKGDVFKNPLIDPLEKIADVASGLVENGAKRVVDMAAPVRMALL